MLLRKSKFNTWDLNFVLLVIGFPFFTMLISDSTASIAYRGFALLVAIICLSRTGIHLPKNKLISIFLFVLLVDSIMSIYGLFFGEYASSPWMQVKVQFVLFNVGIVWVPLLAFICGFERINWRTSCLVCFWLLFYTILSANINTTATEAMLDGRYNMGRISTLGFGDNGSYLVLLSAALIVCKKLWRHKHKMFWSVVLYAGIAIGIFGVAKAGSRGPFLGLIAGLLFLCICLKAKDRAVLFSLVLVLSLCGIFSKPMMENFAPALYNRMMMTIEDHDTSGRDELFENAIEKFEEHPLWGANPVEISPTQFTSVHNVYLEILVASGIIIFIIFAITWLIIIKNAIINRHLLLKNPGYLFIALLFWFNCARGFSGIQLTTNPLYSMAFVGLAIIISRRKSRNTNMVSLKSDQFFAFSH